MIQVFQQAAQQLVNKNCVEKYEEICLLILSNAAVHKGGEFLKDCLTVII